MNGKTQQIGRFCGRHARMRVSHTGLAFVEALGVSRGMSCTTQHTQQRPRNYAWNIDENLRYTYSTVGYWTEDKLTPASVSICTTFS